MLEIFGIIVLAAVVAVLFGPIIDPPGGPWRHPDTASPVYRRHTDGSGACWRRLQRHLMFAGNESKI
jgi:hypothetical protein